MHENVTTAHMVALSTVRPTASRRRLVCSALDFPSMVYLFRGLESAGYELHIVPAEDDLSVSTDRMLAAIDSTTAVVAFSHVVFRTSFIMDAAAIVQRAHEAGARGHPGYVSVGRHRAAGCLRPAGGFRRGRLPEVVVRRPRQRVSVHETRSSRDAATGFTGWLSRRAPFSFDIGADDLRDDAMRMMNGTPCIPAYHAALAGLDIIAEVGVPAIRERSMRFSARLLELVDEHGFTTVASRDPERLAGTVAVSVPDALLVSQTLKARDFLVDYRPAVGIRISPHFYNTMDEVERIMAEIASIVAKKDYERGPGSGSLVT